MDLLYFVLLVGVLIFIHESGHFAMAKLFNVKVMTFSIGFGPKIVRLRGKETEYCVGVFPLGGFVKMLEETGATEPILPEDRKRTFEAQALWKRAVIVLAGPAMNLLFPVLLYTSVYLEDRLFLPPTVGRVLAGEPADGKLLAGDRILAVDGESVSSFPEVQRIVAKSAEQPLRMTVEREKRALDITVTPSTRIEKRELDIEERSGRIGFSPSFPAPVIGVPRPDSPAYKAGLRTFDRIVAINGRKVERFVDLMEMLSQNRGDTVVLTYLRPIDVPGALGGLGSLAVVEPGSAQLTPLPSVEQSAGAVEDTESREKDVTARTGIESSDLYVSFVPEGSSEWKAGLRVGDRITTLNGVVMRQWHGFDEALQREPNRMHAVTWTRSGEPMGGSFQLRKEQWEDELGQHYERFVFRTMHWLPNAPDHYVPNPNRLLHAVRSGLEETAKVVQFTVIGIVRILQGRVSLSSVSGPITIYDIAGQAGAKGAEHFVWAMALISVNLGLVNLAPIPVLDGGHLVFLFVEGVSRRPVSLRIREIASLVGMTLLMMLVLIAFKNDVTRHWDVIISQVRDIFG